MSVTIVLMLIVACFAIPVLIAAVAAVLDTWDDEDEW